jgi:hypothetical protein
MELKAQQELLLRDRDSLTPEEKILYDELMRIR